MDNENDFLNLLDQEKVKKFSPFIQTLRDETDRAAAILGPVWLDNLLETLLKRSMIDSSSPEDLFSHSGILGTFSAKIVMAFHLGLISEDEKSEINLIRKIRNEFAHEIDHSLNFKTQKIASRCQSLQIPKKALTKIKMRITQGEDKLQESHDLIVKSHENPRLMFMISVSSIAVLLANRINETKHAQSPENIFISK